MFKMSIWPIQTLLQADLQNVAGSFTFPAEGQPFSILKESKLCMLRLACLQGPVYSLAAANNMLFSGGHDSSIRVYQFNQPASLFQEAVNNFKANLKVNLSPRMRSPASKSSC